MTTGEALLAAYVESGDHTAAYALADWLMEMAADNSMGMVMVSQDQFTHAARFVGIRPFEYVTNYKRGKFLKERLLQVTIRNGESVKPLYCTQTAIGLARIIIDYLKPSM